MPIPKLIPRVCILFPIPTIALNLPPLKLYNCVNFALNNTDRFAKAQGYIVLQIVRIAVEVKMSLRWLAKY